MGASAFERLPPVLPRGPEWWTGSWNQAHLYRRMAWRLQAQALGGLSERAQRRAGELAEEASLRLRAPRPFWREDGSVGRAAAPARDERLPPIGTVLQRNYRRRNDRSGSAREGLWVSRPGLRFVEPTGAADYRDALERLRLLRAAESRTEFHRCAMAMSSLPAKGGAIRRCR
jgi:hypothetical protein